MRKNQKDEGVSVFSRSEELINADPLEEIFALNLGDFLTEHLINPELVEKIGHSVKDKGQSLKGQLQELISIYSIDNTLCVLGFETNDDYVIYNSIAKTIKQMLDLEECNIYLADKKNPKVHPAGTSCVKLPEEVNGMVKNSYLTKSVQELKADGLQTLTIPMKNSFECIGAFELKRNIRRPLEEEYFELVKITAGLFVTSLGLQKLIEEVKRLIHSDNVSTMELQNIRAQLTAIIGDLGDGQQKFVEKLAQAVDLKGKYKNSHSKDVAELSKQICEYLRLNEKTTDLIYYAGLLQNIGKITLPEELFNKKEQLSAQDWEQIQQSPNAGVDLLMNINFLSEVVPYIHYKSERFAGGGLPEGLKGQSIPFGSRIIAAADAFCAMTCERPHRKAMDANEALEILKSEAYQKWDPDVVNAIVAIKSSD